MYTGEIRPFCSSVFMTRLENHGAEFDVNFILFIPFVFYSIYYPTNALHDTTHMTYINSYMFWHQSAFHRELLQSPCTSQPANICFVYFYEHNNSVRLLEYIKLLKYLKLMVMIIYSILLCYINQKLPVMSVPSCLYKYWWCIRTCYWAVLCALNCLVKYTCLDEIILDHMESKLMFAYTTNICKSTKN